MVARARHLLALLCLFALAGCYRSATDDNAPRSVEVSMAAGSRLNPDEQGESLPTLVRIFQLKGPTRLEGATLESLYRGEKETLGEDLVQLDEVLLSPGDTVLKRLSRPKDAAFLAVVGVFRRPAGLTWRTVVALAPNATSQRLEFLLEDYRVTPR